MIRCRQLQWGPPGRPLTPPLDLALAAGSLTGLIGANGSGKSSLLRLLAGLQPALAGGIELGVPRLGGVAYLVQQQALDRQFPIDLQALVSAGFWRSHLTEGGARIGGTLYLDALASAGPASSYLGMYKHNLDTLLAALRP